MAVLLHGDLGVSFHLVRSFRQGERFRLFHCMEVLLPSIRALLHACLIVTGKEPGHRRVQFLQREELAVSQACVYPVVDDLHLILHLGLLCRPDGLAWYRDEAVVVAHVVHGLVQHRLVLVGFDDGGLEVVRNDYPRHSTIELKSLAERMEEVLCLLRRNTQSERVVSACHRAYKGLHLDRFTGLHVDIYDERIAVTSPGGMYNGLLIQNLDIADVSSERRNPILANVMAQLDYMEKRGSGLTRICNETKALEGYREEWKSKFNSSAAQFQTTIYASVDSVNVGDFVGDVSEAEPTERQRKIIELVRESPSMTAKQMSETLSVSRRTVERDLAVMREMGVIKREGKDNNGIWRVGFEGEK